MVGWSEEGRETDWSKGVGKERSTEREPRKGRRRRKRTRRSKMTPRNG
jgi:hypothetical protein